VIWPQIVYQVYTGINLALKLQLEQAKVLFNFGMQPKTAGLTNFQVTVLELAQLLGLIIFLLVVLEIAVFS